MPDLEKELRARRERGRKLLVPYLMGGMTDDWTQSLAAVIAAGADAVEVCIPFSDPMMDGPVIQEAALRALSRGTVPDQVLDGLARAVGLLDPDALVAPQARSGPVARVVFSAEHGFAGAFAARLLDAAAPAADDGLFVLGSRGIALCRQRNWRLEWSAPMASHAAGVPATFCDLEVGEQAAAAAAAVLPGDGSLLREDVYEHSPALTRLAERLGFDEAALRHRRPDIVYSSVNTHADGGFRGG